MQRRFGVYVARRSVVGLTTKHDSESRATFFIEYEVTTYFK